MGALPTAQPTDTCVDHAGVATPADQVEVEASRDRVASQPARRGSRRLSASGEPIRYQPWAGETSVATGA